MRTVRKHHHQRLAYLCSRKYRSVHLLESGIENVISEPGGYEYRNGEESVLAGDGIGSLFKQIGDRFTFGGQPVENKYVSFINLREIRGIKFGTRAPVAYHDKFYGTDLEIRSRGTMSLKVTDPYGSFAISCRPTSLRTHSTSPEPVNRFFRIRSILHRGDQLAVRRISTLR